MAPPLTAMGGLLLRTPDGWRWRDGREEPRVRDLTAAEAFQFPSVMALDEHGQRAMWVSIPVHALDDEPDLAELIRELGRAARNSEHDPGRIEVPEERFVAWAAGHVVGVLWEAVDEADLFATADALRRQ